MRGETLIQGLPWETIYCWSLIAAATTPARTTRTLGLVDRVAGYSRDVLRARTWQVWLDAGLAVERWRP